MFAFHVFVFFRSLNLNMVAGAHTTCVVMIDVSQPKTHTGTRLMKVWRRVIPLNLQKSYADYSPGSVARTKHCLKSSHSFRSTPKCRSTMRTLWRQTRKCRKLRDVSFSGSMDAQIATITFMDQGILAHPVQIVVTNDTIRRRCL